MQYSLFVGNSSQNPYFCSHKIFSKQFLWMLVFPHGRFSWKISASSVLISYRHIACNFTDSGLLFWCAGIIFFYIWLYTCNSNSVHLSHCVSLVTTDQFCKTKMNIPLGISFCSVWLNQSHKVRKFNLLKKIAWTFEIPIVITFQPGLNIYLYRPFQMCQFQCQMLFFSELVLSEITKCRIFLCTLPFTYLKKSQPQEIIGFLFLVTLMKLNVPQLLG